MVINIAIEPPVDNILAGGFGCHSYKCKLVVYLVNQWLHSGSGTYITVLCFERLNYQEVCVGSR